MDIANSGWLFLFIESPDVKLFSMLDRYSAGSLLCWIVNVTDVEQAAHAYLVAEPADEVRSSELDWHCCHVGGTYQEYLPTSWGRRIFRIVREFHRKQGLRLGLGSNPAEMTFTLLHIRPNIFIAIRLIPLYNVELVEATHSLTKCETPNSKRPESSRE